MHLILFIVFAGFCLAGAINLLLQSHPISSALSLIVVMVSLAVLYLLLGAEFLAAAQVIVYAGAIMVLFIFVIMLLNTGRERRTRGSFLGRLLGPPLLVILLGSVTFVILRTAPRDAGVRFGTYTGGTVESFGRALFTTYLWPFEIASILVLIAIVGAVALAYKEID